MEEERFSEKICIDGHEYIGDKLKIERMQQFSAVSVVGRGKSLKMRLECAVLCTLSMY